MEKESLEFIDEIQITISFVSPLRGKWNDKMTVCVDKEITHLLNGISTISQDTKH